jgi:hypothetical protein
MGPINISTSGTSATIAAVACTLRCERVAWSAWRRCIAIARYTSSYAGRELSRQKTKKTKTKRTKCIPVQSPPPESDAFIIHQRELSTSGRRIQSRLITNLNRVHGIHTNYAVRRAGMNSVTGESGPVSTDWPRPAISHEVPDRVKRPGLVTPPMGLEGAPRRPPVLHVLHDKPHAPHVAHAEHA